MYKYFSFFFLISLMSMRRIATAASILLNVADRHAHNIRKQIICPAEVDNINYSLQRRLKKTHLNGRTTFLSYSSQCSFPFDVFILKIRRINMLRHSHNEHATIIRVTLFSSREFVLKSDRRIADNIIFDVMHDKTRYFVESIIIRPSFNRLMQILYRFRPSSDLFIIQSIKYRCCTS